MIYRMTNDKNIVRRPVDKGSGTDLQQISTYKCISEDVARNNETKVKKLLDKMWIENVIPCEKKQHLLAKIKDTHAGKVQGNPSCTRKSSS